MKLINIIAGIGLTLAPYLAHAAPLTQDQLVKAVQNYKQADESTLTGLEEFMNQHSKDIPKQRIGRIYNSKTGFLHIKSGDSWRYGRFHEMRTDRRADPEMRTLAGVLTNQSDIAGSGDGYSVRGKFSELRTPATKLKNISKAVDANDDEFISDQEIKLAWSYLHNQVDEGNLGIRLPKDQIKQFVEYIASLTNKDYAWVSNHVTTESENKNREYKETQKGMCISLDIEKFLPGKYASGEAIGWFAFNSLIRLADQCKLDSEYLTIEDIDGVVEVTGTLDCKKYLNELQKYVNEIYQLNQNQPISIQHIEEYFRGETK